MTRKSSKHLRTTYGITDQLLRPYVSSAENTVISPTGDRISDLRMLSRKLLAHIARKRIQINQSLYLRSGLTCVVYITSVLTQKTRFKIGIHGKGFYYMNETKRVLLFEYIRESFAIVMQPKEFDIRMH